MAVSRLPLDAQDPHAELSVELDGSPWVLSLDWNERDGAWYLSVFADDAARTPVVEGWRICTGGLPLKRARGVRPEGEIQFVALGGGDADPGRDELGSRVVALYYDREGLAELVASLAE